MISIPFHRTLLILLLCTTLGLEGIEAGFLLAGYVPDPTAPERLLAGHVFSAVLWAVMLAVVVRTKPEVK